ncbi:hypothetical protein L596_027189 [Steinernema carpocapsae]|uniref:Uncharacterized protein n=1 Tax=Steinernema carpocapsae TaxID=34508 RepID=A0A4U5M3L2_STECR|nr:hypothetical protein L596_027189 [Steinernema carpocapsae]
MIVFISPAKISPSHRHSYQLISTMRSFFFFLLLAIVFFALADPYYLYALSRFVVNPMAERFVRMRRDWSDPMIQMTRWSIFG